MAFATAASAQTMSTVNPRAKMKSLFIFQFTKYTEWPDDYKQGDFIIGVVGNEDLADVLEKQAASKKINSQNVVVKRFNSTADISKCHVLYIAGESSAKVKPYVDVAKKYNCLIITEGDGLINTMSAINFVVVGNAINFEMNKQLFRDRGLVVSNSLEPLAKKVLN